MRFRTCLLALLILGLLGRGTTAQTEPSAQAHEEWERIRSAQKLNLIMKWRCC